MAEIHVLDQNTINQIAAGEVVERPASIVKELVENAVDARSTAITIEIKGGGIDFIRITDNGIGIEKDQIKKAFLAHATSKIETAQDLLTVQSLGFRGEALSSICAVAKVELITKTDEGISGTRYIIEGGEEISNEEIGCPEGTTFIVRNLFYNTPARRKFLKTPMTEAGYVEAFVQRLALSRPDISFKFISDNKNKISTAGNGNLKDVIYHIFGRDIAMNLLPTDYTENNIHITGFIGKPIISRGNRNYENYYVGKRYLKNNIISRAIEDGYKGHNMVHKFPFTVLMIEMDTRLYDVNVHPAKMEMRFKNQEELYSAITTAVKNSFTKKELISRFTPGKEEKETTKIPTAPEPFEKKRRQIEARFSDLSPDRIKEIQREKRKSQAPEETAQLIQNKLDKLRELGGHSRGGQPPARGLTPTKKEQATGGQTPTPAAAPARGQTPTKEEQAIRGQTPAKKEQATQISLFDFDSPFLSEEARPRHHIIGQVFRTYWLVEYDNQLFFVDQHAAHEKVMYEKLKKNLEEKRMDSQLVAPPIILNFSIKEKNKFLMSREAFESLGYQIEEFGEDAFCIRAVPANLYGINQQDLFIEILDQLGEGTNNPDLTIITDRLATMACKAAVKGNQTMTLAEMDSLMDQLMKLENPYQCPHGRPTIISMTKYELEKKFKRIQ